MGGYAKIFARPRRLMTGPYLARNPVVLATMAAGDIAGMLAPRRAAAVPSNGPLRIVVANLAHLGDVIVMLPLLRRLRSWERTARLGLVIGNWSCAVLELGDLVDDVHFVDHWLLNRGDEGLTAKLRRHARTRAAAVAEMRDKAYNVAIDAYAYFGNSADLLWSSGIPFRAGFSSGGSGTLYTHCLAFDPRLSMHANQARLLVPVLGNAAVVEASSNPYAFEVDVEALRMASGFGDFVVLHVGPGNRHKDWPATQWIDLGRRLLADGIRLVFTGAAADAAHGAPVRTALEGEDLVGRLSLRGLATLLSRARGLVAIDTMVGHLAAPFHVPTVVVSPGLAPPDLWLPAQPFACSVTHPVPCAPCNRTQGCEAMTCIRAVQAAAVYAALHAAIKAKAAT